MATVDTTLTLDEFSAVLASVMEWPLEMISEVVNREADQISHKDLADFGMLVYTLREKAQRKGWYIPARFLAKAKSPTPAKTPTPKVPSRKAPSRPLTEYSVEELKAIIRPAYQDWLAAGGAA